MDSEGENIYQEWLDAASRPGGMTWQESKNLWEEIYRKNKEQAAIIAKRLMGDTRKLKCPNCRARGKRDAYCGTCFGTGEVLIDGN